MTGRKGQAEADLGSGGEPRGVGDRQRRASKRALPHPGDVAVAGPPDLAKLGEAEPDPHRLGPIERATGRPWPVPWLPPAGGTADATTCSSPKPVQAPQS